jgi:serine/threonine protein kinase
VLGETDDESQQRDGDSDLAYSAPELSGGLAEAGPASDVWSLGVVAYQIGCRQLPRGGGQPKVELGALTGPLRPVVERCLEIDPRRRPSAAEVVAALA